MRQPVPVEVVTIASETHVPVLRQDEHVDRDDDPEPKMEAIPQPPEERPKETEVAVLKPEPKYDPPPKPGPTESNTVPKTEVVPLPMIKPEPSGSTFNVEHIAALIDKSRSDVSALVTHGNDMETEYVEEEKLVQSNHSRVASRTLSVSEIDFIRQQYYRCWSIPAGAKNAQEMIVTIRIYLNPNGSLRGVPQVVELARMNRIGEEFFRTLAESALRAVHKCNPLNLPSDDYEKWQEIELTFNPREMLG